MKKISLLLLIAVSLFGCKSKKDIPDVSGIDVNIPIERFDISFFNILGVSGADTSQSTLLVTKEFLRGYLPIYDSLQPQYQKTDWLQKELKKAFQFVKYYYPQYKTGKAILFLGPFDAPGVATTNAGIAIGLQQYAGQNFSVYQSPMGQELFPSYISRRFAPEFITANCMKAVVEELFPDQSGAGQIPAFNS